MTEIRSRKNRLRAGALAVSFCAVLGFGAAPANAGVVGLIDGFELEEGLDLTGWTVDIVTQPAGLSMSLCGYDVQPAVITALEVGGVGVVTAPAWLVDTSGAAIDATQPLEVSTVSDCTEIEGMWILSLSPLGGS